MKFLTRTLISALLAYGSVQGMAMSKDNNLSELQAVSTIQFDLMKKEIDAQYSQQ